MGRVTITSRPKRWDNSFNEQGGLATQEIERVLASPIFTRLNPQQFSERLSLHDIIKHDTRLRQFKDRQVICGQGDYDSSAYIVLSGQVGILSSEKQQSQTQDQLSKKSFWQKLAQVWNRSRYREVRDLNARNTPADIPCIFIDTLPENPLMVGAGELVGEIAALERSQRTATLYSVGEAELLEIRWQGLRDLMQRDAELKEFVLSRYRERSLFVELKNIPLLAGLEDSALEVLVAAATFQQYGSFDWYTSYKQLLKDRPEQRLQEEQVIIEQGDYLDGLLIVSAGFCRTTENTNNCERTVGYLGKHGLLGLDAIKEASQQGGAVTIKTNVRAIGYVDIITIPTQLVEQYILPLLMSSTSQAACHEHGESGLLEFLVDNRIINGTKTMVIDLERCVRCDECVKACETTHDGNSRFKRIPQAQHNRFMVANACMHCVDPVCMIGCPTGAIQRNKAGGEVIIDPQLCIGCGTCASNCPYDNISMVDIRDQHGHEILDQEKGKPLQQATKCDLCATQNNGPACQRACAHDALKRIDFHSLDEFNQWVAKK